MASGVVIIGAGHAGVQAAASLREEGYEGRVTLIGEENELPYHKPPLSKGFLKDAAARPQILRAEAFYSGAKIELVLGVRASAIDLRSRRLELSDGARLDFDRLVIATGSRPRPLDQGGASPAGVFSLRSIADARAIRDHAETAQDVVVLGGGFIGLEIAATLHAGGRTVTVLEAQDRLLGRAVAPFLSRHVASRLAASGTRIMTQAMLSHFEGADGRVTAAVTTGGERIPADMVIVGIGAVPNVDLAGASGLSIGNGICVDEQMATSQAEILAIGDVASFRHWQTGADVRLESVQNATDQARLAARTIVGHADEFRSVPWFWSDIGDMKLQMVGLSGGSDETVLSGEVEANRFSVFHYRAGKMVAIESVNRPADHMLGRMMLASRFSPAPAQVEAGDLKADFTRWRERDGQDR